MSHPLHTSLDPAGITHYREHGFVVLRDAVEPSDLSVEVDRCFEDGIDGAINTSAEAGIRFAYLPMMCERTPISIGLLDAFTSFAEQLLGRRTLPVRAKAVRYTGNAGWHRDSESALHSIGFICYLEPLEAETGALRVVPGSHRAVRSLDEALRPDGIAIPTRPGDVIVVNEHVLHASRGGDTRRQWRADYVPEPRSRADDDLLRSYFTAMFSPNWDGGYDVDRFPTYGAHWRQSPRSCHVHLERTGAYAAAEAEEAAARARRAIAVKRPD